MQLHHENLVVQNTHAFRDLGEYLEGQLDLLQNRDKAIMKLFLKYGPKYREIASLIGIHEANVSRRIKKIIKVLLANATMQRTIAETGMDPLHVAIAQENLISGMNHRELAGKYECSVRQIRTIVTKFKKHYPHTVKLSRTGVRYAHCH